MNENKTIEVEIKSTAQQAKKSVDDLVKSITNIENVLTNVYLELGSIEKKGLKTTSNTKKEISNVKKTIDNTTTSTNKLTKALSLGSVALVAKRLTMQFSEWMQLSVNYTEQLNLFNVVFKNVEKDGKKTFSTLGKEAIKYQNKLNEAFGTNKQETLKYQALYQSMGENAGISAEYSAVMSRTMTNLTYDLASLYNKSETATAEAIRAGVYAGQTKPLTI